MVSDVYKSVTNINDITQSNGGPQFGALLYNFRNYKYDWYILLFLHETVTTELVMAVIECEGYTFYSNFDSGNLTKVECVPKNESAVVPVSKNGKQVPEIPDLEFNLWTRPDCMGTEFENGNRTWFHFGVKGYLPVVLIKFNLVDLNRQAKMYSQGMAPVYKMIPGRPNWERIRDKPTYIVTDNVFILSFKFRMPENIDTMIYFAFTYPYSYSELQTSLISMDNRFLTRPSSPSFDDIYYVRECVCKSLENRRVDLITISSYYNITTERETRLQHLFPEASMDRPFKFNNKKVIFISARVHPGETPSSFVFNGLLTFLLNREDPCAIQLRRLYVFKMIPFLNPDGVVRGHYRTDTRGVNLNRMYLSPTLAEHPSVYAARALIQYYHSGVDRDGPETDRLCDDTKNEVTFTSDNNKMTQQVKVLSLEEKQDLLKRHSEPWCTKWEDACRNCDSSLSDDVNTDTNMSRQHSSAVDLCSTCPPANQAESGLYMYIDMHGHASKKGIFMYGNHFSDIESNVECMLLPKIMSLNNHNFHFTACNFTERNMYLRDRRDGMSREGSGRVAVLKLTGLVRSYTLECNYNSGRMVNVLPATSKEGHNKPVHTMPAPPKYTPHIFEEVGRALGLSILDLTSNNPNSRIPNSEFHSLNGVREWLRVNCLNELGLNRITMRSKLPNTHNQTSSKPVRCKSMRTLAVRTRPISSKTVAKKPTVKVCTPIVPVERKENMAYPARDSNLTSPSSCSVPPATVTRLFNRSTNRTKGLSLRPRSKRDSNLRSKVRVHNTDMPQTITSNRSVQSTSSVIQKMKNDSETGQSKESPKRIKVTSNYPSDGSSDRLKLREICFIKENHNKKLIAKFGSTDSSNQDGHDDDDDLVVAWDSNFSPKVLSRQDRAQSSSTSKFVPYKNVEASTSKQPNRGNFKTNSFVSVRAKRTKGPLRRLTSANIESTGKIDKVKKRKKLKSKML
ncbi:uncharacterized protein CBL_12515 [Carabus blaptoides fortunei]